MLISAVLIHAITNKKLQMYTKTLSYFKRGLLIITLVITSSSCAQDQPLYAGEATSPYEFNETELQCLAKLQNDFVAISNKYVISGLSSETPSFNILLDSIGLGAVTKQKHTYKRLNQSDLDWVKNTDIVRFGFPTNDWGGKSLNEEIIYAAEKNYRFSIYNKEGDRLFTMPQSDTLDDEVWHYGINANIIAADKEVGYLTVYRTCNKKNINGDYRIFTLRGEPLTSWKKAGPGVFDAIFAAYIDYSKSNLTATIISTKGDTLFSCNNCGQKRMAGFLNRGVYMFLLRDEDKAQLINFRGRKKDVQQYWGFRARYVD